MKFYWLSFCDEAKPEGQAFLGACLLVVTPEDVAECLPRLKVLHPHHAPGGEWLFAASLKAHRLGINPGGQMAAWELTPEQVAEQDVPVDELLTKEDLVKRGFMTVGELDA